MTSTSAELGTTLLCTIAIRHATTDIEGVADTIHRLLDQHHLVDLSHHDRHATRVELRFRTTA